MASVIIPTNDNPTPPGRKALTGMAWGTFIGNILGGITAFINPVLGAVVGIGSIVGGYLVGKNSGDKLKEKELREGKKEVKEPTFWNRGLGTGYLISAVISLGAYFTGIPLVKGIAGLVGLGVIIGSAIKTKGEMRTEYAQAQQVVEAERQKSITQAVEKARAPQPEVAQTPQTQQAPQPETAKFTQAENERRAKAQQAQITPS